MDLWTENNIRRFLLKLLDTILEVLVAGATFWFAISGLVWLVLVAINVALTGATLGFLGYVFVILMSWAVLWWGSIALVFLAKYVRINIRTWLTTSC
jgi:hypothetical protein